MPTQREMKTCSQCGKGTLRPTGDIEKFVDEETGEHRQHVRLRCDNPECEYEGVDIVRGTS